MKIKGIKTESLDLIIKSYYEANKEVLDVWQELMIAAQTDIEVNVPEENLPVEVAPEAPVDVDLKKASK